MQTIIVALVVALAVVYASWRVYDSFRHGGGACKGCKLADACGKKKRHDCGARYGKGGEKGRQ